jgi:hypothetical protein
MIGASVGTWVMAVAVTGMDLSLELLLGMLGPLIVVVVTWELAERTFRRSPDRLTGLMVAGFAGKLAFFGAYVAVVLRGLTLRPAPFVASFTAYFIGLYAAEAWCLLRLFAGRSPQG